MIYRRYAHGVLLDYEALWLDLGKPAVSTMRKHCQPVACDVATHVLLFDADEAKEQMAKVRRRVRHRVS
jgi:hypothetical protein